MEWLCSIGYSLVLSLPSISVICFLVYIYLLHSSSFSLVPLLSVKVPQGSVLIVMIFSVTFFKLTIFTTTYTHSSTCIII